MSERLRAFEKKIEGERSEGEEEPTFYDIRMIGMFTLCYAYWANTGELVTETFNHLSREVWTTYVRATSGSIKGNERITKD